MLPVNEKGEPDYLFMADYVRKIEMRKKELYVNYVRNEIAKFTTGGGINNPTSWKEFFLSGKHGIFSIESGKRLESANMIHGDVPFIGSSDSNNGVTNFVANINGSLDKNLLGVNYNGSVVNNFYHPYKCLFSDDVKRLHLNDWHDNKFVLLYLSTIILQQKNKYSYGYKFNTDRMKRQKILLPVNELNEPDYDYMEQYSKSIILKKYFDYLYYINKNKNLES